MKLSISLVAVRKITSSVPRSNFAVNDLEQAAQLILDAEGIINPIIVRRTSLESYEVVDGDFEYYAAARAREIDARKGEMIGAFVIEDENEKLIQEQVKLLRQPKTTVLPNGDSSSSGSEARLMNLESRFETRFNELKAELVRDGQKLENEIRELKSQIPKRINPLEAFNNSSEFELISKLRDVGIKGEKATKLIEQIIKERKERSFSSLSDVVERIKIKVGKREQKGISGDKMVEIVDKW